MKITYDLTALPERRSSGGKESEEVTAIKAFLAGQQKNMCFEYDNDTQAKRRYDSVRNFRLKHNLQEVFDMYRKDNCIYVLRTKKKDTTAGSTRGRKKAAPDGANIKDGE